MTTKTLTDRQRVTKRLREINIDVTEEEITEVFAAAMNYKERHPELTENQLVSYAAISYYGKLCRK